MLWLLVIGGYLAGSIPCGVLIARLLGPIDLQTGRPVDLRRHGSGNIGATNVWRVLGWKLGLLCFVLDVLKGLLPVLGAGVLLGTISLGTVNAQSPPPLPPLERLLLWLAVAATCILGHLYPVWLRFKGGKGVATSLGALAGVFPVLTIAVVGASVVWIISARLTRMVGISSCLAALSLPVFVGVQGALPATVRPSFGASNGGPLLLWPYLAATIPLALLVIYKHRANIARTIAGTESRIGGKKAQNGPQ